MHEGVNEGVNVGGVMRPSLALARRLPMVLGSPPKSWARPSMVRPVARRLTSSDSCLSASRRRRA